MLERRVPTWPVAHEYVVVVRVDQTRDDRAALQIQPARTASGQAVPNRGKPSVLDHRLRGDAVGGVHRMDLAVDEQQRLRRLGAEDRAIEPAQCERSGTSEER